MRDQTRSLVNIFSSISIPESYTLSLDGSTIAFTRDVNGYDQIFTMSINGGWPNQITAGLEDASEPNWSPDGKMVAFIRHRNGRFDVWIADANDGEARRISPDEGHYRIVGWVDSKTIAVTHDSQARPPDPYLLSIDGRLQALTNSRAADLHSDVAIRPEWANYRARDGLTIEAALFRGPAAKEERSPAAIVLRGGPNFQFCEFYYPLPQILAHEGYVVFAPNFRGSTGYGTAFRNANFREWGRADACDVVDGTRWLGEQPFIVKFIDRHCKGEKDDR